MLTTSTMLCFLNIHIFYIPPMADFLISLTVMKAIYHEYVFLVSYVSMCHFGH